LLDVLSKGSDQVKFEVDLTHDKESVYSNLKQALRVEDAKGSGEAKKGGFVLNQGTILGMRVTVKVWPYKVGTKTVVTADVNLHPTSNEVETRRVYVKKFLNEARKKIKNIVKG